MPGRWGMLFWEWFLRMWRNKRITCLPGSDRPVEAASMQTEARPKRKHGYPESQTADDPRKNLTDMLKYPILSLVMDREVSRAVLDTSQLSDVTDPEAGCVSDQRFYGL